MVKDVVKAEPTKKVYTARGSRCQNSKAIKDQNDLAFLLRPEQSSMQLALFDKVERSLTLGGSAKANQNVKPLLDSSALA